MNGSILLLTLFLPVVSPWICRFIWPHKIKWVELLIAVLIGAGLTTVVYALGAYGQVHDVEILNGEVTGKSRKHDHYLRSYECNCSTDSKGNRSCSTCYEDRYTVTWRCYTNLGTYTIEHLDRSTKRVYNTPDPARYTEIQVGDPVAKEHVHVNYIKAAPDSLFHKHKQAAFANLIPPYPNRVHDFYKINRVFAMGVPLADQQVWNQELSMLLRKLGPQKQSNVVLVFVNTADQSYAEALEAAWIGGKKNDSVVIVGTSAFPKIDWVHITSWTANQLFKVQLRDAIYSQGTIDRAKMLAAIDQHVMSSFVRRPMSDFEYLKDQIEPPLWVIILALVLGMIGSCGASYYFFLHDPFTSNVRSVYTRRRHF